MSDHDTWKDFGPWYPTANIRWRGSELEQLWKRNYELRYGGGVVMGGDAFEEEWRLVPHEATDR